MLMDDIYAFDFISLICDGIILNGFEIKNGYLVENIEEFTLMLLMTWHGSSMALWCGQL